MTDLLYGRCDACGEDDPLPVSALAEPRACPHCGAARLPFAAPFELGDPRQLDALDRGPLPLLVLYGAAWCGATHRSEEALDAVAAEERGRLVVVRIDVDAQPELAARDRVRSLPTIVWRHRGRETDRHPGALQPEALSAWAALHQRTT